MTLQRNPGKHPNRHGFTMLTSKTEIDQASALPEPFSTASNDIMPAEGDLEAGSP